MCWCRVGVGMGVCSECGGGCGWWFQILLGEDAQLFHRTARVFWPGGMTPVARLLRVRQTRN